MYRVETWDYNDSPEQLEKLIQVLTERKQIVSLYDSDYPTGRAVFYFGEITEDNLKECEKVCEELNNFHYK